MTPSAMAWHGRYRSKSWWCWRARRDSNPRPSAPEADALSAELRALGVTLSSSVASHPSRWRRHRLTWADRLGAVDPGQPDQSRGPRHRRQLDSTPIMLQPVPWNRSHDPAMLSRPSMTRHTLRDVALHAGVSKATASRVLNGSVQVDPATRRRVLDCDGRARLHAEQRGASAELRPDPHHQRRHLVPDAPSGCRATARHRCRAERQRVRSRHLQRGDGREARPVPARPGLGAAYRRPPRRFAAATRGGCASTLVGGHPGRRHRCPRSRGRGPAPRHRRRRRGRRGRHPASAGARPQAHRVPGRRVRQPLRLHLEPTSLRRLRASPRDAPASDRVPTSSRWARTAATRRASWPPSCWHARSGPSAIFAASDTQALGVISAAHEAGLRVPDELSVVGYDDIEVADYLELTTVRQQLFESGRLGAELLLAEVRARSETPPSIVLPPEVVVRGTTAPPKEGRTLP